ncbi:hypothetical protein MMC30_006258 [Trapelia coarctata]|nr:hypothetical protein [Trapelia coarctata]
MGSAAMNKTQPITSKMVKTKMATATVPIIELIPTTKIVTQTQVVTDLKTVTAAAPVLSTNKANLVSTLTTTKPTMASQSAFAAIVQGTGTIQAGGACDCSCLCPLSAFGFQNFMAATTMNAFAALPTMSTMLTMTAKPSTLGTAALPDEASHGGHHIHHDAEANDNLHHFNNSKAHDNLDVDYDNDQTSYCIHPVDNNDETSDYHTLGNDRKYPRDAPELNDDSCSE